MSDNYASSGTGMTTRLIMGGAVLAIVAAIVLAFTFGGKIFGPREFTQAEFEAEMAKDGDSVKTMLAIKEYYPQEYQKIVDEYVRLSGEGKNIAQLRVAGFDMVRKFSVTKTQHVIQASDPTLVELASATLAMTKNLEKMDKRICAKFGFDGIGPNDPLTKNVSLEIENVSAMTIKAAHEGETKPAGRAVTGFDQSIAAKWVQNMTALGISQEQLMATGSPATLAQLNVAEKCDITIAIYEAALQLPESEAATIFAALTAEAAKVKAQQGL